MLTIHIHNCNPYLPLMWMHLSLETPHMHTSIYMCHVTCLLFIAAIAVTVTPNNMWVHKRWQQRWDCGIKGFINYFYRRVFLWLFSHVCFGYTFPLLGQLFWMLFGFSSNGFVSLNIKYITFNPILPMNIIAAVAVFVYKTVLFCWTADTGWWWWQKITSVSH